MRSAILKIDMTSFFSLEGGPIWIKFRRLVQNDMSTAMMWSKKSKADVEFQYDGRLGEFNGVSSQSHVPHCRVKEFHPPYRQKAQLSQRDRARFVSLNILLSHSRSFEMTLLSRACVSPY